MSYADTRAALTSEFNGFLLAPVFEEKSGMLLSVLSALARMDIDPWQEADELSHMPIGDATQRLTSLIAGLPNRPSTSGNPETIAFRLIKLLPRSSASNLSAYSSVFGAPETRKSDPAILIFVIMMLVLGIQVAMMSRQSASNVPHTSEQDSSGRTDSLKEQPIKSRQ